MRNLLCYLFLQFCVFFYGLAQYTPKLEWAINSQDSIALGNGNIENTIVVTDQDDNVYLAGELHGAADLDFFNSTKILMGFNFDDFFIAKYNNSGTLLWARVIGGDLGDIAIDNNGDLVVTGTFFMDIDLDPSDTLDVRAADGLHETFLAKYNTNGNYIWGKTFGGSSYVHTEDIAIDDSNNIFLAGWFADTIDIDPSESQITMISAGETDCYYAKYNSNGDMLWTKRLGGRYTDKVTGIEIGVDGIIYITGSFYDQVDFSPNKWGGELSSYGEGDIFLASYDEQGEYLWAHRFGNFRNDLGKGIKKDNSGNIIIYGFYDEIVDFDPSYEVSNLNSNHYRTIFIAKYDFLGNYIAAISIGGSYSISARELCVDFNNNIVITGSVEGRGYFNPLSVEQQVVSNEDDIYFAKYDSNLNFLWVKSFEGEGDWESGEGVAVDRNGDILLTGDFTDTIQLNPDDNLTKISPKGDYYPFNAFLAKYSSVGNYIWGGIIGNCPEEYLDDSGNDLILDSKGNIYITGSFKGKVDFGYSASNALVVAEGDKDAFVAKYDSLGSYEWVFSMGGKGEDYGQKMILDSVGNILVTGCYNDTAVFHFKDTSIILISKDHEDIFLAKYSKEGNFIWLQSFGGSSRDYVEGIDCDSEGNIYITGSFYGTVCFNPKDSLDFLRSNGYKDVFIAKFDSDGNYLWSIDIGGKKDDYSVDIKTDKNNDILLTGLFSDIVNFNQADTSSVLVAIDHRDLFLARFDSDGNYKWAFSLHGDWNLFPSSLTIDAAGDILLTGTFKGTIDVDPSDSRVNSLDSEFAAIFITKYTKDGVFKWGEKIEGELYHSITSSSIICDSVDNIYVSGSFSTHVDFDPSENTSYLYGEIGTPFIAKYDTLCNFLWVINANSHSLSWSSGGTIFGMDVNTNEFTVTGRFNGKLDFDPNYGYNWLSSYNSYSVFVAKYKECNSRSKIHISTCESSYTAPNGATYYESGEFEMVFTNSIGCDSIVTMVLNFSENDTMLNRRVCNLYTVPSGDETYTIPGTYVVTDTLINSFGCDSILYITLTINQRTTSSIIEKACKSFIVPSGDETYFAPGTFIVMDTILNSFGCDSVITISLSFGEPSYSTITENVCGMYTVPSGDEIYMGNGSFTVTDTINNLYGCDSVITIHLNLSSVTTSTQFTRNSITSNAANATYQWLDCNKGYSQMLNDTLKTLRTIKNGWYAVEVTQFGCVDTSDCVYISAFILNENIIDNKINLYPNPTNGKINIELSEGIGEYDVFIRNITGVLIYQEHCITNIHQVSIEGNPGVYFIEIISSENKIIYKVIKN